MEKTQKPLLSVKDLRIHFSTDHGYVQAVRGVSFDLYKGETLCIVGESGSGKSVTNKAIMGILSSNGRIVDGSIMYEGEDLTKVSEDEFHRIRGHKIGMIFQDPLSSLNPIMRIGKQITEAMLINASRTKKMYNDYISNELVAYKNAKTELRTGLAKYSENIRFLKSEKKKQITQAKNHVSNNLEGKRYNLKREYGSALFVISDEFNQRKNEAKECLDENKKQELLAVANQERIDKIKHEKEVYKENLEKISESKSSLIEESKIKIAEITENFDNQIAELAQNAKNEKRELKAKYKPIIKECKKALDEKSKEASIKVKEFKKEKLDAYKKEVKHILNTELIADKKKLNYKPTLEEEKKTKIFNFITLCSFGLASILILLIALVSKAFGLLYLDICLSLCLIVWFIFRYSIFYRHSAFRQISYELKKAKEKYVSSIRITKAEAKARALKVMEEVGIKDPEKRFRQYPFEFSGGMRQRIVIAIALTADPDILICDEPTTALDVTIQAQILELINKLKVERQLSCIFITHDLGVVANMADRVAVMYAGKIVEYGKEEEIFYDPKHPYTWALLSSIPDVDSNEKLEAIPGTPPNMIYPPKGDAFALRSKYAMDIDFKKEPPFFKVSDNHYAATWLLDPRAPKVEMPRIVQTRIANSLKAKKGGKLHA